MTKILGPGFIALHVRNLGASRNFYMEQFGLELAPQSPPNAIVFHSQPAFVIDGTEQVAGVCL